MNNYLLNKTFCNRLCFILSLFYSSVLFGQTASSKLDKSTILIGDQIQLTLEFSGTSDLKVNFPILKDTISKNIEIIKASNIETTISEDKKQKTYKQILTVTSFDSGFFPVKPFRFNYTQGQDTAKHFIETQALMLSVQNVKVDAQKGIRDIKPPLEENFTFREALPYIIGVLLIIGLFIFIKYYLNKKKKKEPLFKMPPKPKLPPHEIALTSLEELRNKKLWQNNKIKEFHSELTEIIRKYIEERYNIQALEMVSDDIIEMIKNLDIDVKIKSELKEMLTLADLVKFAKENPLPSEHDRSFNNALDFVKNTIISINISQNNNIKSNN